MKYLPIVFILLTAGCSTKYTPPSSTDTETALIKVTHISSHQNSTTKVNIFDNEDCQQTSGFGRLALVGDKFFVPGKSKTLPISANKKTYFVIAGGGNQDVGSNYYKKYSCWSFLSFTPLKNEEYEIYVNKPESPVLCNVVVLNKKTGETVESLERYKFKKECGDQYVY